MNIILDIAVIAFIVFSFVRGIKKGLVKTAFGLVAVVAALLIAYNFSQELSVYVQSTQKYQTITDSVRQSVTQSINQRFEEQPSEESPDTENNTQNNDFLENILKSTGINLDELDNQYRTAISDGAKNTSQLIDELIITPVSEFVCRSLSFAVLFLASLVVIHLVILLLDVIFKLPLLNGVNKFGGALLGTALGVLKALALCTLVNIALLYFEIPEIGFVRGIGDKTYIFKTLSEINPLSFLY